MAFDAQRFFEEFLVAAGSVDKEAMRRLMHPDVMADMPQTGERTRGFEHFWAEFEHYPGGAQNIKASDVRLVGNEERWAVTPGYTVIPLAHAGTFTVVGKTTYPDGSIWHTIFGVEIHDGKVTRVEAWFAPEMPAPILAIVGTLNQSAGT